MAEIILLMANIDLDRRNLWRKLFSYGGEKTAIGDVQKALILRVKEPIGETRAARVHPDPVAQLSFKQLAFIQLNGS